MEDKTLYTVKLFLNSVIPLFRIVAAQPAVAPIWQGKSGVVQFSVATEDGLWGTHFVLEDGQLSTYLGVSKQADVRLHFKTVDHFIAFFKNQTKRLPQIKGFSKPALLISTFRTLLKMAGLLAAKTPPQKQEDKQLMTQLMFYLLTSGISQLNKLSHPDIAKWAKTSPDRVYALAVDNCEQAAAYIRVKAGNSKAMRGHYKRSKPFFTMRFVDIDTALAILLQTGDMLALTAQGKLKMEGAPEFGAKLGDYMMLVGDYIQ